MRQSRPLLPIRPPEFPARLGRRQHVPAGRAEARVRFERNNLAVALVSHPVWLRGPLFKFSRPQPSSAVERHAA